MFLHKFYDASYNFKAFTYLRTRCACAKRININPTCVSESSSTDLCVNSSGISKVNNVNNVNKASSSSSTVGDGIVNVSRNSSRSVVPTAAVLAAELLKRTTPTSVVGVPKCRKKL